MRRTLTAQVMRCITCAVAACIACMLPRVCVSAQPASGHPYAGVSEFAGRLVRNHPYLFAPGDRATVDELNRRLREAERKEREGRDPGAKQAAAADRDEAAMRLLQLVENSPNVIRVDLTGDKPAISSHGPFTLPGDSGGLLLKVICGPGETRCKTSQWDFSDIQWEVSHVSMDMYSDGTTWVIVTLSRMPMNRTSLNLEFKREGKEPVRIPIDVMTPTQGRLKITILAGDTGRPTPAMVNLTWKTDGIDRKPSNAIDFGPQFDRQGNASGRRNPNLPGRWATPCWCVPGPIDMSVPPGEWEVWVRHGIEFVPAFTTIAVKSGETAERTITLRRWVDMRKLGWWSGDDHVHGQILSDDDAARLMTWIQAEDIHVANIVKMGDISRTYFEQRGFGPQYRVIDGDYVLSPGQECPRTHDQIGHTLAMNTTSMVRDTDKYYLYDTVFDAVHAQGGLTGYAHINSGIFHVHRDMSINIPKNKVDFGEVLQFNHLGTDLYYDFLNLGFKLTASTGSDVPWGGTVGENRAYAYLGKPGLLGGPSFSADAWFEAYRRGRTFVTSGPMIEFRVDDAMPGDQITVRKNRKLRVKARTWGDPDCITPSRLEIVRNGDVIRAAESNNPRQAELKLDFEVDAGHGCWIAARAEAREGTRGHTTPVYVVREGLRFWKFEAVDELIAKRMASLDEVERIVAEARNADEQGKVESNRAVRELARQGPELLKRVAAAREIYEDLKKTAAKERDLRGTK